ncbi:hypothetical protein [Microcoleus sp. herbarium14]
MTLFFTLQSTASKPDKTWLSIDLTADTHARQARSLIYFLAQHARLV